MCRAILVFFALAPTAFAGVPAASAAKRVALVVGIDQYDNLNVAHQLKKAVNDAHAVGETFRSLGYDVIEADNLTRLDFLRQWQTFLNRIEPGDEAAFFFAGHGVEIGGLNVLLPRDVPQVNSNEEQVLKSQGLSLSEFLDQVRERKPQIALYVVDACRDNPFTDSTGRGIGGTRGLARVEPPSGTFVMFSAGAGETALDRLSDNDADPDSVYTRSLIPQLKTPGKSIAEIARDVRREVRGLAAQINHVQTPAYYDEVVGNFCPAGCDAKLAATEAPRATSPGPPSHLPAITPPPPLPASTPPPPTAQPSAYPARDAWNAAKDTDNESVLRAFIAKFGDPFYASLAKERLTELAKKNKIAEAPPPPKPAEPSVPNGGIAEALALIRSGIQCGAVVFSLDPGDGPIHLSRTWTFKGDEYEARISYVEDANTKLRGRPLHYKTSGSMAFKYADLVSVLKTGDNEVEVRCLHNLINCITETDNGPNGSFTMTKGSESLELCDAEAVDNVQKGALELNPSMTNP